MKTLLAVIACAGLLGGCAVAPVDSPYAYGYAAPYAYGPYYDYGPYYYGPAYYPGYYGYYSAPVIVGGVRYYSHGHHGWHDRNGHAWHGERRAVTAAPNRSTRTAVAPAQRAPRGNAPAMSRAPAAETRPAS